MRVLKQEELHLVAPELRQLVLDSWAAGEDVPYTVTCVSRPKKISARQIAKFFEQFPEFQNTKAKNNPQDPPKFECQAKLESE